MDEEKEKEIDDRLWHIEDGMETIYNDLKICFERTAQLSFVINKMSDVMLAISSDIASLKEK